MVYNEPIAFEDERLVLNLKWMI